jgi:hypothetical protein
MHRGRCEGTINVAPNTLSMPLPVRESPELGLALLRRELDRRAAGSERCGRCRRTPLIGERVYMYDSGALACELCRSLQPETPRYSRKIHGPEFGHTMRITDQRAAA